MPVFAACREIISLFELIILAWHSVYMCEGQGWNSPRRLSENLHAEENKDSDPAAFISLLSSNKYLMNLYFKSRLNRSAMKLKAPFWNSSISPEDSDIVSSYCLFCHFNSSINMWCTAGSIRNTNGLELSEKMGL